MQPKAEMTVPFLDLAVRDPDHKRALMAAVERVLDHGRIVHGPEVTLFEEKMALSTRRKFGVGVSSGTNALYLALRAAGVGPDDEVITTALSWVATANAVAACGARPVFADIRDDLNIDPAAVADAVTERTKAIVPVHYTGLVCDMPALQSIAAKHGLAIVEDAAQAFGARLGDRPAGSFGTLAAFSMNAMKVLRSYGDAGAVVTDDPAHVERLRRLVYAGVVDKERCVEIELNSRIDTVQAAMLLVNLERVEGVIAARRHIAEGYRARLSDVVDCPVEPQGSRHVYYVYTILADDRDGLKAYLDGHGIETKIHHPILMPDQPAHAGTVRGDFPTARRICARLLSIPAHEALTDQEQDHVVECIRGFYRQR